MTGKRLTVAQAFAAVPATCGACAHFRHVEEDWGNCKRSSPLSQMLGDDNGEEYQVTFWPQVDRGEGSCGEFRAGN